MGIFKRKKQKRSVAITDISGLDEILCSGYTNLSENPEVKICINLISNIVSNMTMYLMQNTKEGDTRIIDELAKKIDINPCPTMTKKTWLSNIVQSLLLNGNAIVVPHYSEDGEYLRKLEYIPYEYCTIIPQGTDGQEYMIMANGRMYSPEDVCHFVYNPNSLYPYKGDGVKISIKDVVDNLKQAERTKSAFMSSKWKPSLVISADGLIDEMNGKDGRERLLNKYVDAENAGTPWIIPSELLKVEQIKPLSLQDLAINEAVEIDKKTVAGIFGVPSFFVGSGDFNKDEYNVFVQTVVLSLAKVVEQELTKKLLKAGNRYFKFNISSVYYNSFTEIANVDMELYVRGLMTGNEVRDSLGMSPDERLNQFVILENYIPADKIGDQKKLTQNAGKED